MKPKMYVGIGASAGGLEALERFFRALPSDSGLAYIVVQHLSPDYKSLMVELLQRYTNMDVLRAEDGVEIEGDRVYLIPPRKSLTMYNGKLFLEDQQPHHALFLPIDIFFRSLAIDQGKNSIAIVLSGTGSDGTLGVRAVKEAGGMIMVQDESSSKFDGMPRSAIGTGIVDYVLAPEKMPEQLLNYIKHPYVMKVKSIEDALKNNKDELSKILGILREKTGADFSYYKPNTIIRRIERRMSVNQIEKISNYIAWLLQSPNEVNILYRELLIGVTRFFRDEEAYEKINSEILPKIFSNKKDQDEIRVWSAGCSTGEEAYSIAMLIKEFQISDKNNAQIGVKIFASDIDKDALEYAGVATYPESIVSDVPDEFLKKYFVRRENGYQITERIRRMVVFAPHNVIKDPPFSKIDLVTCRNTLIYFKPAAQQKVLSMFHYSLQSEGFMFLGSSESLGELEDGFVTLNNRWKIYQYKFSPNIKHSTQFSSPSQTDLSVEGRISPSPAFYSTRNAYNTDLISEEVVNMFLPSALIVNENYEIVHLYNKANKYIRLPSGRMTYNILKLVDKNLSLVIGSILHKVFKNRKEIKYTDINVEHEENLVSVEITARFFELQDKKESYAILVFNEQNEFNSEGESIEKVNLNVQYEERFRELEQELQFTKENLQSTIEELETSNEELQSTNEELIASNEELQSTNEELQSVNEELYTVNAEYQKKIEELTELNNDIDNLLSSTKIGTLFLDTKLRIRKFTPVVTEVINLMESDIGRPIFHVSQNTNYPEFFREIEQVQKTLIQKNIEVQNQDGNWYLIKILPYRTQQYAVEGIIVSLVDISDIKRYEEEVIREKDLLKRVLENSPVGKTVVDMNGNITFVNRKAAEILGFSDEDLRTFSFDEPKFEIQDYEGNQIPTDELPFPTILRTKESVTKYKHSIVHPDGTKFNLIISGAPMFDKEGNVDGAVFSLDLE